MFPNAPQNPFRVSIDPPKKQHNFFTQAAHQEFAELLINVDSVLNLVPHDITQSAKEYYCSVRYPNEPFDSNARRRSIAIRANPGVGRCYDCILHAQLSLPYSRLARVILVSIWEVAPTEDYLIGEAAVPLDDQRISQTNPWPLRERSNAIVRKFLKTCLS